jgi:1-phosphatidylinositol-3-phosphate 5-kinase
VAEDHIQELLGRESKPFALEFNEHVDSEFSPTINVQLFNPIEFCALMSLFGLSVHEVIQVFMNAKLSPQVGGKSDSKFFLMQDKKFLIKTVSSIEMNLLTSGFLHDYVMYMFEQPGTYLVKFLAVFTVSVDLPLIKYHYNCIAMENVSCGFDQCETYDLKGVSKDKWIEPPVVKLDTNYRTRSVENQVVLPALEKEEFLEQFGRDSSFLVDHRIMDYSLLVIVCRQNLEIRMGIIDYCRSYTLDKALESMVKQTPLYPEYTLPPTVISPSDYLQRFINAMNSYFHASPRYGNTHPPGRPDCGSGDILPTLAVAGESCGSTESKTVITPE